jgi:hypothetical protein
MKTNLSVQRILKIAGKVLTHKAINTQTGETGLIETTIMEEKLKEQIEMLNTVGH